MLISNYFRMALISAKDVDKFKVKLVEGGNSQNFQLNSQAALAPKHEDLQSLAASIQSGTRCNDKYP